MPTALEFGQFFGPADRRHVIPGFVLADRRPDTSLIIEPHTHEEAHFVVVLAGSYLSSARGAPPVCGASTVIFNPPGTTHRDRFAVDQPGGAGRFFAVSIGAAPMARATDLGLGRDGPCLVRSADAVATAHRLRGECRHWHAGSTLVAEGLCLALLGQLDGRGVGPAAGRPPAWLLRVRDHLHSSAAFPGLSRLAADAGVHPISLTRAFRRHFGAPPTEYHRNVRLADAERQLRLTNRPVAAIAIGAGFADQSHFTRAFRRRFGRPPGAHRRGYA